MAEGGEGLRFVQGSLLRRNVCSECAEGAYSMTGSFNFANWVPSRCQHRDLPQAIAHSAILRCRGLVVRSVNPILALTQVLLDFSSA